MCIPEGPCGKAQQCGQGCMLGQLLQCTGASSRRRAICDLPTPLHLCELVNELLAAMDLGTQAMDKSLQPSKIAQLTNYLFLFVNIPLLLVLHGQVRSCCAVTCTSAPEPCVLHCCVRSCCADALASAPEPCVLHRCVCSCCADTWH